MLANDSLASQDKLESGGGRNEEAIRWLEAAFHSAGQKLPEFSRSEEALRELDRKVEIFKRRTEVTRVLIEDMQEQAAYFSQEAGKLEVIAGAAGLAEGELSGRSRACIADLADVGDALQLSNAYTSSYLVGIAKLNLQAGQMEDCQWDIQMEKRAVQRENQTAGRVRESLEKVLRKLKDGEVKRISEMEKWSSQLAAMAAKEDARQQRRAVSEAKLQAAGFDPSISHEALVQLAEEKQALEDKMRLMQDNLRQYLELPPDFECAQLILTQKEEEFEDLKMRFDDKLGETLY